MSASFLPFAVPDIGDDEIAEVVDSMRSGWITTGPKTKRFESEFAEFLGAPVNTVAVNSATAGLHLALEAIGIGPGDEVITTTHTFTATAEVIRYLGAHPVLVDMDPTTLNISPPLIEKAITERTRAIIPVHYGGLPCPMDEIVSIARSRSLRVIEDAAHAIPASIDGRLIGSLETDATVFSFYATKPVATGEGGMLVTADADIAERARVMRLHGINRDAFDRYTSTRPAWYYEVVAPGYKYNMTDLAASLGIHQLRKAWRFQKRREEIAERYHSALRALPLDLPPRPGPDVVHAWHLYAIRLHKNCRLSRDAFIQAMADRGIGCSVHYIPLHLQPYWRDTYGLKPGDFPAAQAFFEGAVSLPIYTRMTDADQDRVIEAIEALLSG